MTKITLYQAAIDIQNKIQLCVDEDGVLDMEKFALIEGNFQDRAIATTAVIKTLGFQKEGLQAQLKAINDAFNKQIKSLDGNASRLKENLAMAMKTTNTIHVKSDDGLLDAKLYLERDESIEIDDGAVFDESLLNPPAPRAPSKTLIREAIERGEPIAGAIIVRKDRLVIK